MKRIKTVIDPNSKFTKLEDNEILQMIGIIPQFIYDGITEEDDSMKESCDNRYGFGFYEITGGTINDDQVFQYPNDSDLDPLITFTTYEGDDICEICNIYRYAITSFHNFKTGETFVTRMD
ncbi:MAG: hypothetical protein DRQ45_00975 [Gammaproteobacteria bacterium]|nr:MAG: hypothetical protein DRQ45_00975 [Gammaproteobacteria bacterium]